jgi:hypothetical protein
MGIELVVATIDDKMEGVCFVLPNNVEINKGKISFVWLFHLATRPSAKNLGAFLIYAIISMYPSIMCIGVSPQSERLFKILNWEKYTTIWRCVHPINLNALFAYHQDRITSPLKKRLLTLISLIYHPLMRLIEFVLGFFAKSTALSDSDLNHIESLESASPFVSNKRSILNSYLPIFQCKSKNGSRLEVIQISEAGRITEDSYKGIQRVCAHAAMWKKMRKNAATFTEYIITQPQDKISAILLGYVPLPLPIYYTDRTGSLSKIIDQIPQMNYSFLNTDKII